MKLLPILYDFAVASLADAWIKTIYRLYTVHSIKVASLADAWIKTTIEAPEYAYHLSHPSRMRGLKPKAYKS